MPDCCILHAAKIFIVDVKHHKTWSCDRCTAAVSTTAAGSKSGHVSTCLAESGTCSSGHDQSGKIVGVHRRSS